MIVGRASGGYRTHFIVMMPDLQSGCRTSGALAWLLGTYLITISASSRTGPLSKTSLPDSVASVKSVIFGITEPSYTLKECSCRIRDSNPYTIRYWFLRPARLPIPPIRQVSLTQTHVVINGLQRIMPRSSVSNSL